MLKFLSFGAIGWDVMPAETDLHRLKSECANG